jgi:hypothetical protein
MFARYVALSLVSAKQKERKPGCFFFRGSADKNKEKGVMGEG